MNADQADTSFTVEKGANNIHTTQAQVIVNIHHAHSNEFGASNNYAEIQDKDDIFSSSKIVYEKIDQDLRYYNPEQTKQNSRYSSLVPLTPESRIRPQLAINNLGNSITLPTEKRIQHNTDYLHPIGLERYNLIKPDPALYLQPCQMDANKKRNISSAHQNLNFNGDSMHTSKTEYTKYDSHTYEEPLSSK